MSVIAGGGAEPFQAFLTAPGLLGMQETEAEALRHKIIHQLQRRIASHKDFLKTAAEDVGPEPPCFGRPGEYTVVAHIGFAVYAVFGVQNMENVSDKINLAAAGSSAGHIQ